MGKHGFRGPWFQGAVQLAGATAVNQHGSRECSKVQRRGGYGVQTDFRMDRVPTLTLPTPWSHLFGTNLQGAGPAAPPKCDRPVLLVVTASGQLLAYQAFAKPSPKPAASGRSGSATTAALNPLLEALDLPVTSDLGLVAVAGVGATSEGGGRGGKRVGGAAGSEGEAVKGEAGRSGQGGEAAAAGGAVLMETDAAGMSAEAAAAAGAAGAHGVKGEEAEEGEGEGAREEGAALAAIAFRRLTVPWLLHSKSAEMQGMPPSTPRLVSVGGGRGRGLRMSVFRHREGA